MSRKQAASSASAGRVRPWATAVAAVLLLNSASVATSTPATGAPASAHYRLSTSVLDGGGAPGSSTGYRLTAASLGQVGIGDQSSPSYKLRAGYVPTLGLEPMGRFPWEALPSWGGWRAILGTPSSQ